MNARLAARLTGWKIDITSDSEFAQQEAEAAFGGEDGEEGDFSGRCAAVLSNGKRCPGHSRWAQVLVACRITHRSSRRTGTDG